MTAIAFRKTVLGVKVETTKGTPVKPASATDYVRLQDDFTGSPDFENLDNAELTGSIGLAKPIRGLENPTGSFSHYLRHSGVEGTAPNYAPIMKALLGSQQTNATQRVTAASSTVSLIKVAAATGSDFVRGIGMLIKDSVNGYRIRVSHSRSTDDITPSFNVPAAPAIGVSLGKCIAFLPANEDHDALSLWGHAGNGGALQLFSGSMITEMSATMDAGQLINANFSFEALRYLFNPIEITASDRYLDFEDDDGVEAAIISAGYYTPHELATALQLAMNSTTSTEVATVTYDNTTGKFTIKTTGTLLTLMWNTGSNTANTVGDKLGFSVAADDSGTAATTGYTSDNAQSWVAPHTPTYDTANPLAAKANEVMIGDADDYACFGASSVGVTISNTRTPLQSVCAESGREDSIITQREVTISVTARLKQHDAEWFERYRNATSTRFQYSFGTKIGGNWVAGTCGYVYGPSLTVSSFNISQEDNVVTLEMELKGFIDDSGNGEIYMGYL